MAAVLRRARVSIKHLPLTWVFTNRIQRPEKLNTKSRASKLAANPSKQMDEQAPISEGDSHPHQKQRATSSAQLPHLVGIVATEVATGETR